jgi:hypothetical protein
MLCDCRLAVFSLVVGLCLVGGVGCTKGPDLVPVSGQVLIDDKPLTTGYIQVIPDSERAATGQIDSEGRFTLSTYNDGDGCVRGTHPVVVMASRQLDPSRTEHLIPPKYSKPTESGLTVTIEGPTKDLKVRLSWDGGKPYVEQILSQGDVAPVGTE